MCIYRLAIVALTFSLPALISQTFVGFPAARYAQESKGELVKIEYDQKKDLTQISLNPIVLASRKFEELRLGAVASYQGKVKVKPKEIVLIFLSLSANEINKYESARKLTLIADGKRISVGETQHSKQVQQGLFIESMMISIPTELFLRISWSKALTVKLGFTEVELSPVHITALRAAASYMIEN
jgi:hypothetical protein